MSAVSDRLPPRPDTEEVPVLLVDDYPANLDLLEAILRRMNVVTTRAESGVEALKRVLEREYACCLMDVRMPGMDGFETARLIREDAALRNLPIIFVTAEAADQKAIFRGYEAGAVDYMTKPLEPAIVRSKVKIFGDLYLQRQELARSAEIENLNAELASANEALNAANEDLEHFTHIAAHDLCEPIRKQCNLADLLARTLEEGDGEEARQLSSIIGQSAEQMLGMIDAFRALTKIEYNSLVRKRVDMRQLAEESLGNCVERAQSRRVSTSFSPGLGVEHGYERLIRVLYDNLVKNAFDHADADGFELAFTAEPDPAGGATLYGVRNTASTIPAKDCGRIFKIFRKAGSEASEGRGVGLSICKRVIDRHNGRIYAESGSDFVHIKFTLGEGP